MKWFELSSTAEAFLSDPNSLEDFDSDWEDGMLWVVAPLQSAMEELVTLVEQVRENDKMLAVLQIPDLHFIKSMF